MQNRIVEINSNGAHISASRGFLSVSIDGEKTGQIAIDDMAALIVRGYGASLSVNICERLARANVPIIICGTNQAPASVLWPVSGHFSQGIHMQAQADAGRPLKKRLWASLIKAKIRSQSMVLEWAGEPAIDLQEMAKRVKSGDTGNLEAQAARRYWPRLMGDDFTRDQAAAGRNAALNYGYTIVRAAVARSLLAAGLHPSLSLQHQSRGDALRLADDMMEPFRPWVDLRVYRIAKSFEQSDFELDDTVKADLVSVLSMDMQSALGATPMQVCMDYMAQSLVQVFLGNRRDLELPGPPLPLDTAS